MGWMRWVRGGSSWFLVLCAWLGRERGKKRGFNHESFDKLRTRKQERTRKKEEEKLLAQRRKGRKEEEF
jgi:hypothetical protein